MLVFELDVPHSLTTDSALGAPRRPSGENEITHTHAEEREIFLYTNMKVVVLFDFVCFLLFCNKGYLCTDS